MASLRPLVSGDVEAIVDYWFGASDEFLDTMGIDRAKLGRPADVQARYEKAIPSGDPNQMSLAWAIDLDDRRIGYTLLNRYTAEHNHSHWHIIEAGLRGNHISSALYPHRIKTYFDAVPGMERLIHQTRSRNAAVNRMLDKYVPIAETRFVETPDGAAAPGEFHMRYVRRAHIPALFERAKSLGF
jgi:hypothetical protein